MTESSSRAQRWQRVGRIFDEAAELPPKERAAFLDEACGEDTDLREHVDGLLAADADAGPLDADVAEHVAEVLEETRDAPTFSGRLIGRYQVSRRLGAGGMGVVYEAWDTELHRPVAVKVLPPGILNPASRERFLREARTASRLDHPNLCAVHDIGESDDGRVYIVMALYRGETLKECLGRGPLPFDDALDLARQTARGLAHAHRAGVVHRDVKPANVLVTDGGEVKILDFGIAKQADETGLTRSGAMVGTPAYMAPEQIKGSAVDGRADVWALGVMLYEMVAGRLPFPVDSPEGMIDAVLHRDPAPLTETRRDVPEAILRIVRRALAKPAAERYADAGALLEALGEPPPASTAPWAYTPAPTETLTGTTGVRVRRFGAAALLVTSTLLILYWLGPFSEPTDRASSPAAPPTSAPTGLVVLPFRNLTADPDLDSLGQAITEMLVTDLRGSPDLDVLTTRRLHQALAELGALDEQPLLPETVRELTARTGHSLVVGGSFSRLGERYRILFELEDTDSGSNLLADQLESHEKDLFAAVDELSVRVRGRLEAGLVQGAPGSIREITTDSLTAMRHYSEGLILSYESRSDAAIGALQRAVEIDPRFALAWRRLGLLYLNVGQFDLASEPMEEAFELAHRLPVADRFTVQADYYSTKWPTLDRSSRLYEQGLALYPQKTAWRTNLGVNHATTERYEEALAQFEAAIASGTRFWGAASNAALVCAALGKFDRGQDILQDFIDRDPGNWRLHAALGMHLLQWGRLEEAGERLRRAGELSGSLQPDILDSLVRLHILRGDWPRAQEAVTELIRLDLWEGSFDQALLFFFQGRTAAALESLDAALRTGREAAITQIWRARFLLQLQQSAAALEAAREAQRLAPASWIELRGLFIEALARQELGDGEAASALLETLRERGRGDPNVVEERQLHQLAGLLALARGDLDTGRIELRRAAAMLPVRGVKFALAAPQHVPIWLALGEAARAAGDTDTARAWLERAATAGSERLEQPVAFTRSLSLYGQLSKP